MTNFGLTQEQNRPEVFAKASRIGLKAGANLQHFGGGNFAIVSLIFPRRRASSADSSVSLNFFGVLIFVPSANFALMILTSAELGGLVNLQHRSPHTLLGMHPLGDGSGVVVRAFLPGAAEVEISPTHEKKKPKIKLKKIHDTGIFEGISKDGKKFRLRSCA